MIRNYIKTRQWVILFAFVIMVFTMVPYLIGYASENENWRFTGFVIGVEDGNSYIAKMISGSAGAWLFKTPYSTMEQRGVLAFLPYILLGKFAAEPAIHEQMVVLFHGFRFVGGMLAILASYDFISLFINDHKWRFWALCVYVLGGGAGWILVFLEQKDFLGSLPLEFISPESFGFLGLLGFPHLAFARAMLIWGFVLYIKNQAGYLAGIFWIILGLMQPMYVVVGWSIITTHILLQLIINRIENEFTGHLSKHIKRDMINGMKMFLISSPLIIYTAYAFFTDPFLRTWAAQNSLPSPHFIHYLVAYGLYLPMCLIGIKQLFIKDRRSGLFFFGWLGILPVLIYSPVMTQRRLAEGIWIVIVLGLIMFFETKQGSKKMEKWILYLAFPSTLLIFIGAILTAQNPSLPVFRPREETTMHLKVAMNVAQGSIFLSGYDIGNNLPAWAPITVVYGHGPETANFFQVKGDIEKIYSPGTGLKIRSELIKKYGAEYIIFGPSEDEFAAWDADSKDLFEQVYNQEGYAVYRTLIDDSK